MDSFPRSLNKKKKKKWSGFICIYEILYYNFPPVVEVINIFTVLNSQLSHIPLLKSEGQVHTNNPTNSILGTFGIWYLKFNQFPSLKRLFIFIQNLTSEISFFNLGVKRIRERNIDNEVFVCAFGTPSKRGPPGWCPDGQRLGPIMVFPLKNQLLYIIYYILYKLKNNENIYCIIDYLIGGWEGGIGITLNIFNLSN